MCGSDGKCNENILWCYTKVKIKKVNPLSTLSAIMGYAEPVRRERERLPDKQC